MKPIWDSGIGKRYELELFSADVPAQTHSMFSDDLCFTYEGEPHRFATKGFLLDHERKHMARVDGELSNMPPVLVLKNGDFFALYLEGPGAEDDEDDL